MPTEHFRDFAAAVREVVIENINAHRSTETAPASENRRAMTGYKKVTNHVLRLARPSSKRWRVPFLLGKSGEPRRT
jgi:hypothetical protein